MTQKHWCVRAARERQEGVKTHRYAVLKGCWEWDIVRPPAPVQITPELPTVTVFYSRVARNLLGSREKKCGDDGDDLNTAVGISVIVTALVLTYTVPLCAKADVSHDLPYFGVV